MHPLVNHKKACHVKTWHAFTLLELIAAIAILGILTAAAVTTFGHASLGNYGAKGYARKLALDMKRAKREAICSGTTHIVQFDTPIGGRTGHTLYRSDGGTLTQVGPRYEAPADVILTPSSNQMEFHFDGSAGAAYTCTVAGPDVTLTVSAIQATGFIRVQ